MKIVIATLGILVVLSGCISSSVEKEIVCRVECIDCKKIIHECRGIREDVITEIKT